MSDSNFQAELEALKQAGLYRSRRVVDSAQGMCLEVNGQAVLNFCSNDYLGMARHPEVTHAFRKAAEQYGVGSGSAHLVCGHGREHHALEEELAAFTGRDRALLFSTGYMANIGVIAGLMGRGDTVYEDKLNHASLLDGGLLSGAKFKRYLHNHIFNLKAKIEASTKGRHMIVTDGVFSMDGDFADLKSLVQVRHQHDALLLVDDAHGLGVLGDKGGGLVELCELTQEQVPLLVGTFGKAFGTCGAFVAGSEEMIEILIQKARSYIYTTALPPAIAAATRVSLRRVQQDAWRREKLQLLVARFQQGANQLGLTLMPSKTAIQPILFGTNQKAIQASEHLLQKGILVGAIRPPTVPVGSARLRITFSTEHKESHIDQLLSALESLPT